MRTGNIGLKKFLHREVLGYVETYYQKSIMVWSLNGVMQRFLLVLLLVELSLGEKTLPHLPFLHCVNTSETN